MGVEKGTNSQSWLVADWWHVFDTFCAKTDLPWWPLPARNKLSSFLHLSWGNLVSCVWQAACPRVRFQPKEGRASSRGKLSSFCQTTGKKRSFSLPLLLLSLSQHSLSFCLYQTVPLVKIFTFPVPVMLLSAWLCRVNRQALEDETASVPQELGPSLR